MDDKEKLDKYLEELQNRYCISDSKMVQIKMFLSHNENQSLRCVIPRGSIKKKLIVYPQVEYYKRLHQQHFGYTPRTLIFDELMSQVKPTL